MIGPATIRRQAERLYQNYLSAWLSGNALEFPCLLRGRKQPATSDFAGAADAVRILREGSKEARGFGYSVSWREVNSRTFGRNRFPEAISFETPGDLLKFLGKEREFARLTQTVTRLREAFPELENWIRSNANVLLERVDQLDGLLAVVSYLRDQPRPMQFARELPLSVDTKFIERNQAVLRQWLDIVLPAHAIRADEVHFERRFGLRYAEPHVLTRFLDERLQREAGFPTAELSLPVAALKALNLSGVHAIIVENKVNLLTLPAIERGLALGGLGAGVMILRDVVWLTQSRVTYWGDLDVDGFAILSSLRSFLPEAASLMMDEATLVESRAQCTLGNAKRPNPPPRLTPAELAAFQLCCSQNLRLEQEHLPQSVIVKALKSRTKSHALPNSIPPAGQGGRN